MRHTPIDNVCHLLANENGFAFLLMTKTRGAWYMLFLSTFTTLKNVTVPLYHLVLILGIDIISLHCILQL